jgi:hypothetical protein
MQYVHQVPPCAVNAGFEIAEAAHIYFLAQVAYPAFAHTLHKRPYIAIGTAVINHLYLHFFCPHILHQHTAQAFFQVAGTIVYRYHYRE